MFYVFTPTLVYERSLPYKIYIESTQTHDTQNTSHTSTYVCTLHIIPRYVWYMHFESTSKLIARFVCVCVE